MIIVIRQWYSGRSERERRLILAMLAIALPLLAWLVLVLPLSRAYEVALDRHLQAVDRNGRVRALAGVAASSRASAPEGDLTVAITDSAGQAGVTLDSNAAAGPDSVAASVAQAPPTAVMQWLSRLEAQGLRIDDLRIVPARPGGVSASLRLSRTRR